MNTAAMQRLIDDLKQQELERGLACVVPIEQRADAIAGMAGMDRPRAILYMHLLIHGLPITTAEREARKAKLPLPTGGRNQWR